MKKSTQFRKSLVNPKSRKHQNQENFSDVKPWVIAAIAEEERQPNDRLWKKAPSADDAYTARLQRVRFLEKYVEKDSSLKPFAERLDACEPRNRCLSGACPE